MIKRPQPLEVLEEEMSKLGTAGKGFRDSAFSRFPILFSLSTTFGLVATLYGFEKVIDKIDFLNTQPEILLLVGLVTLAGTGTLYKKLQ